MEDPLRRRAALSLIAGTAVGLSGCVSFDDGSDDQAGPPADDATDDGEPNGGDDGDSDPSDDETNGDDGDGGDDDGSEENGGETDPSEAAAERALIDRGEVIDDFEAWYASGGSYVSISEEEGLTDPGALEVELFSARFATAGYDFEEPFALGDRHLSLAVKVESPTGGELEVRVRAPDRNSRLLAARDLPPGMSDWMRVDMGFTQGEGSPDLNNVESLRVHVKGAEETDVRYWIDDLRATENSGDSYAILAFYGGDMSVYEEAFPILEDRNMQAAVAVPPSAIGSGGRLGLDELRELRNAGWDVCSYPSREGPLPDLEPDRQREIIDDEQNRLIQLGFEDGARHFFAPRHRIDGNTIDIVRDLHETGFVYGGNSAGMPPTAPHTLPVINGEEYDSSRSAILRADIHDQLVTLAIDGIGPDEMSTEAFEAQLDRIEENDYADGLNVITPSDLVDDHL